jgi:hypothetical protein
MARCAFCRGVKGVWPVHSGGKVCDSCKDSIERCDSQRGTGGKPKTVQGCFSQPLKTTKRR